jgi:leucyl aminopeptidase
MFDPDTQAPRFADPTPDAIPVLPVTGIDDPLLAERLSPTQRTWLTATGLKGTPGSHAVIPAEDGRIACVVVARGTPEARARTRFALGAVAAAVPGGTYRLDDSLGPDDRAEAALGWLLAGYRYDRRKDAAAATAPGLVTPDGIDRRRIESIAAGECLTRELINTPANDMGPAELEAAARALAVRHGGQARVTTGDDLIAENLPLVHAVGRASDRAPRLIDLRFGGTGPAVALVGKGVVFDTGGLNLKPGSSMALMKKDMGGAATVLGLAEMICRLRLDLRLRVLIPAVENSVAGNAFRPGDILTARNGLTVEINNTDAEGRLVLADALALAAEETPDLIVSMATLTGAARVAVGPDLAPFYTDSDALAAALSEAAARVRDPVWRMPFHAPYEALIEPGIADLDNAPSGGMAGSITAALFLRRFTAARPYLHFDIYGWQQSPAPARPKGGVGQGARALLDVLAQGLPG